jgi:glycerol-3-phosphate acyltransferase PlsY
MNLNLVSVIAIGYLLGSIPFGYLIARLAGGADIRRAGSGNIGATNVPRVVGAWAGIVTLLLDGGKGALAVWIATRFGHGLTLPLVAAAVAAIVGHMFPAWLGFRGGRGVATAIGAFLVIGWLAVVADLVLWLIAAAVWRYASLSSILWAVALPLMFYWLYAPGHHPPPDITVGVVAAAVLILWRHRPNLRRLIEGTESRLSFRR